MMNTFHFWWTASLFSHTMQKRKEKSSFDDDGRLFFFWYPNSDDGDVRGSTKVVTFFPIICVAWCVRVFHGTVAKFDKQKHNKSASIYRLLCFGREEKTTLQCKEKHWRRKRHEENIYTVYFKSKRCPFTRKEFIYSKYKRKWYEVAKSFGSYEWIKIMP